MRLPADPSCLAEARRWGTGIARREGASPHAMRVLALLVTEAVANAVVHGRADGEVELHATVRDGVLRVGVDDLSPALPVVRDAGPGDAGGRGVMLIDRLARRWGVEPRPGGKQVWFEVSL